MKKEWIEHLRCPDCAGALVWRGTLKEQGGRVEEGLLHCAACAADFPVVRHIPRFVSSDNYASSFGFEWLRHARTQYDETSGCGDSRRRFFSETKWAQQLPGQRLLEVGSGSGRFTAIAADTGAFVISFDYSQAVEANYASNGQRDNVMILQADLYRIPLPESYFDGVFCLGVLQHTPNVERSFKNLPRYLVPGGRVAVDVYAKMRGVIPFLLRLTSTHYRIRAITRRMNHERLYRFCTRYIRFMWPLAKRLGRCGRVGAILLRRLLIPPYFGVYDLPEERMREWMTLDMFDALSPRFDQPQFLDVVDRWFHECDLADIDVTYGYNGVNGRGRRKST
jgi:SAM-dependent methyltransferase